MKITRNNEVREDMETVLNNMAEKDHGNQAFEESSGYAVNVLSPEEEEDVQPVKKTHRRSKKGLVLGVLAVIMIMSVSLVFAMVNGGNNSGNKNLEDKIKAEMGIMDDLTPAEIAESLAAVVEEGSLRIGINMNPTFMDGSSEGILDIENHPNNHYDMRCVIYSDLDNNGKITEDEYLYHSGLMPINKDKPNPEARGSHITSDVLEINLPAGEYDATAHFTAHDPETDMEVGAVNANIRISVLN